MSSASRSSTTTRCSTTCITLFGDKSRTTVKSYLAHRQVAVNDMPVTQFDTVLHAGDELKINFKAGFSVFKHNRLRLVYEDEYILVIDKGYGSAVDVDRAHQDGHGIQHT